MIRNCLFAASCSLIFLAGSAQDETVRAIDQIDPPSLALAPLRFLAADELMGRATARSEIHIAARYIAEAYRSVGLKECSGAAGYFQTFTIHMKSRARVGSLTARAQQVAIGSNLLEVEGGNLSIRAPMVYAGFGTQEELDKIDIKGKIVLTSMGTNDSTPLREALVLMPSKQQRVYEKGGLALIERFRPNGFSWAMVKQFFSRDEAQLDDSSNIPVFMINEDLQAGLGKVDSATLSVEGVTDKNIPAENVLGWIEGTDLRLKNQFVVLSAHYDHLGVAKQPKMEEGKLDSIYNGARDNAIGTTAVIDAARYFSLHPAKRSILFIAYTGEEIGEIGSRYFSMHPVRPLRQLVYNLNIDNASYNDTSIVTVIGLGRTSADGDIRKACVAYGLTAMPDPAPEQNLFDRSDNVNLAIKGIPAPTFSLGIRKFDQEINKRYHQLSDEVGNFDLNYAMKFIHSFILAAKYIADDPPQPLWKEGDKYEAAWKQLQKP